MKFFCCLFLISTLLFAEEIILKNGNRLFGKIVEETETSYVLETGFGVIHLKKTQIREVLGTKSLLEQYWEKLNQISSDDIESFWKLSRWCEEKGLKNQRDFLYQQILALNPNHLPTRYALGHRLHQDRWVSPAEFEQLYPKKVSAKSSPLPKSLRPQEIQELPEPLVEEIFEESIQDTIYQIRRNSCSNFPFYSSSSTTYFPSFKQPCHDFPLSDDHRAFEHCKNGSPSTVPIPRVHPDHVTPKPTPTPKKKRIPKKASVERIVRPTPATTSSNASSTLKRKP